MVQRGDTALQAGGSIPGILFLGMSQCFFSFFFTIPWVALVGEEHKRKWCKELSEDPALGVACPYPTPSSQKIHVQQRTYVLGMPV